MKNLSIRPVSLRSNGIAVVISLLMLAILCVAVVSILTLTLSERQSSASSVANVRSRQLAETAVNLVVGQIRNGTSETLPEGVPAPWTSQPGAIRSHTAEGDLHRLYKLYSAADMVIESVDEVVGDVPTDWSERPPEFVDLNRPEQDLTSWGETRLRFPILDPRARGNSKESSVEGFDYQEEGVSGVVEASASIPPSEQRLPMPVRWLYTLEDGTLGHLDEKGNFIPGDLKTYPSRDNPISGRIAFWTDDESSKINVNTASEGVFWDTPRADSAEERALGKYQPASGEFQRFPGHPAMVSLSSVLLPSRRFAADGSQVQSDYYGESMLAMARDDLTSLWGLSPLIDAHADVTSMGGTQIPADLLQQLAMPVFPRSRRISSVQDLYWNPVTRAPQPFFHEHPEAVDRLAQSGFFLTSSNAAPELNLFGRPRISMWPVHGSLDPKTGQILSHINKVTNYDRKAAMASYLGDRKYYITRQQAWNGAADFSFFMNGERENEALFSYLQELTNQPIPGFHGKGSFGDKYGAGPDKDRDNILLAMMDYIRLSNLNDGLLEASSQFCVVCAGNEHVGFGQVTGLAKEQRDEQSQGVDELSMPKGMGRVLSASEIGFMFICRAEVQADGSIKGTPSTQNRNLLVEPGDRELEVALLIEGFVPAHGWGEYRPYASVSLGGIPTGEKADPDPRALPQMEVCGVPLEVNRQSRTAKTGNDLPADWLAWGGSTGVRVFTDRLIQFDPIVIGGEREEFTFSGSVLDGQTLAIALFDTPDSAETTRGAGDLIQTIAIPAPPIEPGRIRVPRLPEPGMATTLRDRWKNAIEGNPLISANDVVQTLVPNHGDYRLIAGKRFVGGGERPAFVAHPDWGSEAIAHAFVEPSSHAAMAVSAESPAANESYIPEIDSDRNSPDFPIRPWDTGSVWAMSGAAVVNRSITSVFGWDRLDEGKRGSCFPHITGDFDNGVGLAPNGPYINRPDDGETRGYEDGGTAYFTLDSPEGHRLPDVTPQIFSPHRMIPSPVMFGSLPTGVQANVPWQTLLFRPQENHYGWTGPRDHLLLDLFWMPVVEPVPISRPFETEGKINMNHELIPFHYIERKTALHALMKSEKLIAIPDKVEGKLSSHRRFIDPAETLQIWDDEVFSKGNVFLTSSQICEMPLVPEGERGDREVMEAFWDRHRLTGDNSKERPYAHLYPRLTTRSNTFRVHYIAQSLKKVRTTDPKAFVPGVDQILSETKGSRVIERSIDPHHSELPDYVGNSDAPSLEKFYRYHLRP